MITSSSNWHNFYRTVHCGSNLTKNIKTGGELPFLDAREVGSIDIGIFCQLLGL